MNRTGLGAVFPEGDRQDHRNWTGRHYLSFHRVSHLPKNWLTPARPARAQVSPAVRFAEKWRLAVTLLGQVRAPGFTLTAGSDLPGSDLKPRSTRCLIRSSVANGVLSETADAKIIHGTTYA